MSDLSEILPDWLLPTSEPNSTDPENQETSGNLPDKYTLDDLFEETLNDFESMKKDSDTTLDSMTQTTQSLRDTVEKRNIHEQLKCEKCKKVPSTKILHDSYCPYCWEPVRVCREHLRAVTPHGFKCNSSSRALYKKGSNRLRTKRPERNEGHNL